MLIDKTVGQIEPSRIVGHDASVFSRNRSIRTIRSMIERKERGRGYKISIFVLFDEKRKEKKRRRETVEKEKKLSIIDKEKIKRYLLGRKGVKYGNVGLLKKIEIEKKRKCGRSVREKQ